MNTDRLFEDRLDSSSPLEEVHDTCSDNQSSIARSTICGCFCCLSIFAAESVETFVGVQNSALCPHCHTDTVLPNSEVNLTEELLEEMKSEYLPRLSPAKDDA